MNTRPMFSSATDLWSTPQALFDELDSEFHFTLDVCALPENAKCPHYFTPEEDGLKQEWTGVCWCNPPYGRELPKWVEKAANSAATVVMLIPARTDTKWFHDWVLPLGEIRWIRGRIKFGGGALQRPVSQYDRYFSRRNPMTPNDIITWLRDQALRAPEDVLKRGMKWAANAIENLQQQVPPCRIGEEVWCIRNRSRGMRIHKGLVSQMYYADDMQLVICVKGFARGLWGERVFGTREEAEAKLYEIQNIRKEG